MPGFLNKGLELRLRKVKSLMVRDTCRATGNLPKSVNSNRSWRELPWLGRSGQLLSVGKYFIFTPSDAVGYAQTPTLGHASETVANSRIGLYPGWSVPLSMAQSEPAGAAMNVFQERRFYTDMAIVTLATALAGLAQVSLSTPIRVKHRSRRLWASMTFSLAHGCCCFLRRHCSARSVMSG